MFVQTVQELAAQKGITIAKMRKDLGLGQGTFSTWKKRGTIPNGDVLREIADYFGVSVDYLLGNEKQPEAPDLADTEMQDVIIYNRNGKTVRKRLPKAEYEAAIKMLDALGSDFPDV